MTRLLVSLLFAFTLVLAGCASDTPQTTANWENSAQAGEYQVHGAVIHPGTFNLSPREELTLGEAIRLSGGFKPGNEWDDGGNPDFVHLQRVVHGSVVEYTLRAAPGGSDESFVIRPGDYIFVPKRTFSSPVPVPLPYAS
jgi:protein involved in polysaccharide export with SLBB domain